jgi:ERF superfamily
MSTTNVAKIAVQSPLDLLSIALQNNAAIDVIERLAALQTAAMTRDAEVQFNDALNLVQGELRPIAADLENPQTKSRYASYAGLDRVIRPIYVKHGFSLSFDSAEHPREDMMRVVCYVAHRAGHTRRHQVDIPADGKGAKGGDVMTKTHAAGAAMSYGMRYLLKAIFNIAIGEEDRDGNGLSDLDSRLDAIGQCETLVALDIAYVEAYKAARKASDTQGMKRIVAARDARKRQIQPPPKKGDVVGRFTAQEASGDVIEAETVPDEGPAPEPVKAVFRENSDDCPHDGGTFTLKGVESCVKCGAPA